MGVVVLDKSACCTPFLNGWFLPFLTLGKKLPAYRMQTYQLPFLNPEDKKLHSNMQLVTECTPSTMHIVCSLSPLGRI